ncbi:putative MATE family efflux protein [Sinobacterium caligoides]|uniref:Putative MATE family efflux protein n=1 Tax=Sinobacterium caligoides TaxID=933926 RepID=A0A3N2DFX1_9GAMM|nr:MATE family efflux transporter [Sinobacterium caligoides]ROR98710.1 putative MATE family efflux protein [Sinobacterium caligoides]
MANAKFVTGRPLKHIITMTLASTVGLLMLFTSDLVDMYFLSLLDQRSLVAAIGFAGTLLFFTTAACIGLQVGMGALVAKSLGAGDRQRAGEYCSYVLLYSLVVSVLLTIPIFVFLPELLRFLGASHETLDYAVRYGRILLPATPLLALGMGAAAALRAQGDAKRSMLVTVLGALVNVLLDPLFIFTFGWGLEGAAWASVCSRVALMLLALYWIQSEHRLPRAITFAGFIGSLGTVTAIAGPAMLTSLATPLASSFVVKTMAQYGDEAVAGSAIIGRIVPVAFAAIFALSGAVGPIIGQNAGAALYCRVRRTIIDAMLVNLAYCLFAWMLLFLLRDVLIDSFSATGLAAELIDFYCHYLVLGFVFSGVLFVANAGFNNLGQAYMATVFNFARSLLGVIPFVYWLSALYGPMGVLMGEAAGVLLFAVLAFYMVLRRVRRLELGISKLSAD